MRVIDIDYENLLIYGISYKTFMGAKPLLIWFDKVHEFIKTYDGISYLVLFASEIYNPIYDKINYLTSEKSGITYSTNHNFARIRIDPYYSFSIEKILTFHNVITLIKPIVNKNESNYYVIHQIDSKNDWLLISVIFMAKHELVFVLTFENAFS